MLYRSLMQCRTRKSDRVVTWVSKATDDQHVTILAVTMLIGALGRRGLTVSARGLVAAGLAGILANVIKNVIKRARPSASLGAQARHRPYQFGGAPSFPSAHAAASTAFAASVARQVPGLAAAVHAIAAIIGYSRLHLGTHYATDVLGGALLGAGVARTAHRENAGPRRDG